MNKLLLLGPIKHLPSYGIEEYRKAETLLRSRGFLAVYMHQFFEFNQESMNEQQVVKVLTKQLMDCQGVIMLKDWSHEPISVVVVGVARQIGIDTISIEKWMHDNNIKSAA